MMLSKEASGYDIVIIMILAILIILSKILIVFPGRILTDKNMAMIDCRNTIAAVGPN